MSAATLLVLGHGALLSAGLLHDVQEIPPEDQTSPGLLGFLVTFAVAAAVIGLGFSLVRHLRVVDRNARRLEAQEEAARADAADPGTSGAGSATAPATTTDGGTESGAEAVPPVADAPRTPPADAR